MYNLTKLLLIITYNILNLSSCTLIISNQLILSCMKDKNEYTFELKDHLLKNDDADGWREIPAKPNTDDDEDEDKKQEPLQGKWLKW